MTDETPQSEGEPSPATPAEESPTAETKPLTNDEAVQPAGDEDDVTPSPAAAAPLSAPAPEPTQAAPAAATPLLAAAAPERPAGIFIPKWVGIVVAAIVAALVFGGIGYAIGDSSDSGSTTNAANELPNRNGRGTEQFPGGRELPGDGNLPNGGRFPGGQIPGNGGGNGIGGGTTASNAGFLGVAVQTASDGKGVEITQVASNSPAAKAGLQQGDVITQIDGKNITNAVALRSAVQSKQSGDEISVTYTRNGSPNTVKVTLTSRSAQSN